MKKNPLTVCTLIKSSCTDVCDWKKPFFFYEVIQKTVIRLIDSTSEKCFCKLWSKMSITLPRRNKQAKKKQTVPWNWHNRPCIMQSNNTWLGESITRRAPRHNLSKYLKWLWCFRWYLQYISIIVYICYRCLIDKVESIRLVACKDLLSKV